VEYLGDIFTATRIAWMTDGRFDHGRVDAHLSTSCDVPLRGKPDDSVEKATKGLPFQQLTEPHHRLGVGDFAAVDATEVAVHEVAHELPLELLVAPILQVFEHQHSKRHLRGRAIAAATAALVESTPHRLQHPVDEHLVIEQLVDHPQLGIHQRARVGRSEENCIPESSLPVAPANHLYF